MAAGNIQFSPEAREALKRAHEETVAMGHNRIGPGHLLIGLAQDEGPAGQALKEQGATLEGLQKAVKKYTPAVEKASPGLGRIDLLDMTQRVLARAVVLVHQKEGTAIGCEHLLLAIVELEDERTLGILKDSGLDREEIRRKLSQDKMSGEDA